MSPKFQTFPAFGADFFEGCIRGEVVVVEEKKVEDFDLMWRRHEGL